MTPAVRVSIEKEVRALLLPWLACVAALGGLAILGGSRLSVPAIGVSAVGAIVLGAWSIGHEYANRTLSLWLSQPISRARVMLIKFGVVALMLMTLLSLAALVRLGSFSGEAGADAFVLGDHRVAALILPLLIGLFLAPCLTMVCRNPLAGSVFTIALLVAAWGSGAAWSSFGYGPPAGRTLVFAEFRFTILSRVIVGLSPLAAIMGWYLFTRLEAIDGGEGHLDPAGWLWRTWSALAAPDRRAADALASDRRPFWQLAKKELHIQQMTLMVGGLYTLLWAATALVSHQSPEASFVPRGPVTLLYCLLLGLLAGSLTSAEERQFGMLEWQVLQPIAVWKQWAVKAGVALGTTLVVGLALPIVLALLDRPRNDLSFAPSFIAIVLGACVVGLYISSFTTSGVRALLTAIVLASAMAVVIAIVVNAVSVTLFGRVDPFRAAASWRYLVQTGSPVAWLRLVKPSMFVLLSVFFVGVLYRLSLTNHRFAERAVGLLARQVIWLVASLLLAATVFTAVTGQANRIATDTFRQEMDRVRRSTIPGTNPPAGSSRLPSR